MMRAACENSANEPSLENARCWEDEKDDSNEKIMTTNQLDMLNFNNKPFTICTEHFGSDNRKVQHQPFISTSMEKLELADLPIPKQLTIQDDDNYALANDSGGNVEIVAPTTANLKLLQAQHSTEKNICNSGYSTTSTTNTDICVLETHNSIYNEQHYDCPRLNRSFDTSDFTFTMLHAPHQADLQHHTHEQKHECAFEESTEVLLLHCDGCKAQKSQNNCSSTDSDVEVLMSEEINVSDWSAGIAVQSAVAELVIPPHETENINTLSDCTEDIEVKKILSVSSSSPSASVKQQESTDQDISVEDFSGSNSVSSYEQLNRHQLLNVIRDQAEHIRKLEETLQRYRSAKQLLCDHVNTMRAELDFIESEELQKQHGAIM